eukprot:GHVP01065570.1.p1 GENE.GHVP01065570.1~~GHVP01065570.1.p1  ORF type:complete len:122 (-),score=11.74 GHVP01065570.1:239-604(-)
MVIVNSKYIDISMEMILQFGRFYQQILKILKIQDLCAECKGFSDDLIQKYKIFFISYEEKQRLEEGISNKCRMHQNDLNSLKFFEIMGCNNMTIRCLNTMHSIIDCVEMIKMTMPQPCDFF